MPDNTLLLPWGKGNNSQKPQPKVLYLTQCDVDPKLPHKAIVDLLQPVMLAQCFLIELVNPV